jgi:adenylate kinase family enzyme
VRRISVVGNSGSGKTTLARRIAAQLQIPHLELDDIFHLPGWQELAPDEFRREVAEFTSQEAWVIDGNYRVVQDLVWQCADTVIWLDLPRRTVMRQVVPRTLRRLVLRTELWDGNREPWSNVWSVDPQRSILAWAWTQHDEYRHRYTAAMHDPALAHLQFVVLRSRREIDAFLSGLAQSTMAW